MTQLRYFAEINGQAVRFDHVDNRNQSIRHDDSWGWDASSRSWIKIDRVIQYKSRPSRHACDSRCINASGRTMQCECSCGGKNHGRGSFNCEAA